MALLGSIMLAVGVLGALALAAGALLVLAARRFAVEVDARIMQLEEALPGLNCGVCGFPGCSQFAEAVASEKSAVDGCLLGGSDCATDLAQIMGIELQEGDDPGQAYLMCGGGKDEAERSFEYIGVKDCHMAAALGGGPSACSYGCIGFGSCVPTCPLGLIHMGDDDLPIIDSEACTGCGECIRSCPKQVLMLLPTGSEPIVACRSFDKGKAVRDVCSVGCVSCRLCVKACPEGAVEMDESGALAIIDYHKCENRKSCIVSCPTNTIISRELLSVDALGEGRMA